MPIKEFINKIQNIADGKYGYNQTLFDPMFREYNGKYYLGVLVINLTDEDKIMRPTKWLLFNIETFDLAFEFDSKENDYTDTETFPFDRKFDNYGNSSFYSYVNFFLKSFNDWKKNAINEFNIIENDDEKVLKIGKNIFTIKEFVTDNIEEVLGEMNKELAIKLSEPAETANENYLAYLLDDIITEYTLTKKINKKSNQKYIDVLKYSYPDLEELIDRFNNI